VSIVGLNQLHDIEIDKVRGSSLYSLQGIHMLLTLRALTYQITNPLPHATSLIMISHVPLASNGRLARDPYAQPRIEPFPVQCRQPAPRLGGSRRQPLTIESTTCVCGVWLQVNKPYLPLAAGDMTPSMANAVVWGTAVAALAIGVASGSAPLVITLAMRCSSP
jgi:hypothetical protein